MARARVAEELRASNHVARASPMPAIRKRVGAAATTEVSTTTASGLRSQKRYSRNSPSELYTTDSALVGASVDAIVGTTTSRSPAGCATALAVSITLPPPTATTPSTPSPPASSATRSISSGEHSPPKSTVVPGSSPSCSASRSAMTASRRTRGRAVPTPSSTPASSASAPGPCT